MPEPEAAEPARDVAADLERIERAAAAALMIGGAALLLVLVLYFRKAAPA